MMSKSLDLKVILAARDKITGPLKKINATSSGTARALKQAQAETKDLQRQQSDVRSFRAARAGLRSVEQGLKATRSAQSDYQRSLESQRKTHDDIKRQTKEARAAYRSLAGQMQRTKEPTAALNRDFHLAAKRLSDLEVKQDRSYSSIKRYKEGIRSTDKQLGVLNKEKDRHSKNLDIARKKLNEAGISTKNLGRTQRDLTDQVRRANERIQRQKTYLEQLGKADVSGKFNNMTSEVTRFGRRALMATTGVAAGIFGLANSTAGLGDHAAKTADELGLTVEAYQEMVYAGERSGIAQNTMDSSMRRFVKRTGEAARGAGAARQAYEALGLSAEDLSAMQPDEALAMVADRLQSVSNHGQKVDLASQLFGNEGAAMLNLLKDGSAGLQQLRRDARITGYVMSEESARDAVKFKDALLDAQLGLKGMKNTIGAELMPAVTDMMGQLFQWMSENRDQVKAFAREFGQRLKQAIPVIRDIAVGVWSAVRAIGSATASVAGLVGGFDNLAMIMVAMFAMKPVLAILAFGKSLFVAGKALAGFAGAFPIVQAALLKTQLLTKGLWLGVKAFIPKAAAAILTFSKGVVTAATVAGKALWAFTAGLAKMGLALLANPITWIVAGVAAAIAGAAYLIYKNWDGIAGWFSDRWSDIKQAWSEGLSGIGKLLINWSPVGLLYKGFSALMSWLGVDMPANLTDAGGKMIGGLVSGIRTAAGTVFSVLSGLWGQIKGAFSEGIAGVGKLILNWSPLGLFYKAFSGVLSWFGVDLPESFSGFGKQILDGLVGGIMGGLNRVKDTITNAGQKTIGWFKDVLGIKSPSRVFMGAGRDTLEGYRRGLVQQEPKALKQVNTFGKRVRQVGAGIAIGASTLPAAADNVQFDSRPPISGPVSAAQQPAGDTITININAAQGQSAQEIAAEVDRILQARDRRKATRARSALYDRD
jgi:hypothetical protein